MESQKEEKHKEIITELQKEVLKRIVLLKKDNKDIKLPSIAKDLNRSEQSIRKICQVLQNKGFSIRTKDGFEINKNKYNIFKKQLTYKRYLFGNEIDNIIKDGFKIDCDIKLDKWTLYSVSFKITEERKSIESVVEVSEGNIFEE